jgi:hypothetical protein
MSPRKGGEATMIGTPVSAIATAGAALFLTSLLPGTFGQASDLAVTGPVYASAKADRLSVPAPAQHRATVSTVELIGISNTTVVLRDRNGAVLFRSDPLTNTTLVGKDVDLPVVTLKEEVRSPVVQQPAVKREGNEPPATKGRKNRTPGCEGAVSPLANRDGNLEPGLCLAAVNMPFRS